MKKVLVLGLLAVFVLSMLSLATSGMVRKRVIDGECGGRNVSSVCQNCCGKDERFYWQPLPGEVGNGSLGVDDPVDGTELDKDGSCNWTATVTGEGGYTGGGGGSKAACQ